MNKNQKGFGAIQMLLILVVVAFIVFVGWYVWQQLDKKSAKAINSFKTCAAAGNPIMESYPEQCLANGKTYTNSEQTAQELPSTISQGVKGYITLLSGNCMPTIAPSQNSCSEEIYAKPSKVIIKRPVDLNNKESKEVVKEVDIKKGAFEIELQPGLYNMYVLYNDKEYCNLFGGQKGEDCEFTVTANKVTGYTIQINNASS